MEGQHIASAAAAYRHALNLQPDDTEIYRQLARLYGRMGAFDELGYIAQRRLEQAPGDPESRIWLARAILAQRKTAEAPQRLEQLVQDLAKHKAHPTEYVEACLLLAALVREETSKPASSPRPSSTTQPGKAAWADTEYLLGHADRAEQLYRQVLQSNREHPRALNGVAWLLATVRHAYGDALKLAERARTHTIVLTGFLSFLL